MDTDEEEEDNVDDDDFIVFAAAAEEESSRNPPASFHVRDRLGVGRANRSIPVFALVLVGR